MNKITTKKVIGALDHVEATKRLTKRRVKGLFNWRFKVSAIILGGLLSGALLFFTFYQISKWYDLHRVDFRSPVTLRLPILISLRVVEATASGKTQGMAEIEPFLPIINEAYRKIRFMESTAGMNGRDVTATHNYCQSIGKVNEIGYLVDGNRKFCFEDYGEQFLTFKKWFQKRLAVMGLDEALCLWNVGIKQPMCTYSQKYHNL